MLGERCVVSRSHRDLLVVTAVVTFLLVTLGGIVCATHASGGCPDWPRCQGGLVPPLQMNAVIEYTHRLVALLAGVLIATSAIVGWRRHDAGRALRILPTIAMLLTVAVAVFGALAVLTGLSPLLAAVDLGTALIVLALVVATAALACVRHERHAVAELAPSRGALSLLSVAALGAMFAVVLLGVLLAGGSVMRCLGGPLQLGAGATLGSVGWTHALRWTLALVAACFVLALVAMVVRRRDIEPGARHWTIAAGVLLLLATALSLTMVTVGPQPLLLAASAAVTAGMWSALVVVAVRARLDGDSEPTAIRGAG